LAFSKARLELRYGDRSQLSLYWSVTVRRKWAICSRCGVLTAVLSEIEGRLRAVVRLQSMVEHSFPQPEVVMNFESESVEERAS
jgi:hypothetical protein